MSGRRGTCRRPTTLLDDLSATVPAGLTVVVDTTYGEEVEVGTTGAS